jgi:hypothetical protein
VSGLVYRAAARCHFTNAEFLAAGDSAVEAGTSSISSRMELSVRQLVQL